jgi:hypothetical protein
MEEADLMRTIPDVLKEEGFNLDSDCDGNFGLMTLKKWTLPAKQ